MNASLHGVRVVCFYPWSPFTPSGAWTRFSCLWKYLLQEGAQVTLAFLYQGHDVRLKNISVRFLGDVCPSSLVGAYAKSLIAADPKSELQSYSANELNFLLMYEKELYLRNPKVAPFLDDVIKDQDVVTCEYPMYVPMLSEYCKKWGKPLVVTSLDALYQLHGSHPTAREKLKQQEVLGLGLADARVFCNESERQLFAGCGLDGVTVLNTGDVLAVRTGEEDRSRNEVRTILNLKTSRYVLFVGSKHAPNVEAASEIHRLSKLVPELAFVVAGTCCEKKSDNNFVSAGVVSEEVLDLLYRGATAVIVPLKQGTGSSLKTFQAMAYAKPVVATLVGARGLDVTDGSELLLVETPDAIPGALRRLLEDEALRLGLAARAREYAVKLDYRTHFQPYGDIICRLTNRTKSTQLRHSPSLILADNNLADQIGHHFNYALSLKAECEAQGVPFHAMVKQRASADVLSALSASGVFTQGIHEEYSRNFYPPGWKDLRKTYDFLASNELFSRELEAGFADKACAGDLVFLPNATPRQILGLALLLVRNPIFLTLKYVVVLRYSVNIPTGPLNDRKCILDKENAELYSMALEKLHVADPEGVVRLATDSAELANEFSVFSKKPVEVLPIPHTTENLQHSLPAIMPAKTPKKVRMVYLGDAREEKGFSLLYGATHVLGQGPIAASVEFVMQAFVSSEYHENMAQVISAIEQLKRPNVHLIKNPLTSDEYQALLHSADLVLIPYDAVTYRARTSGPFVEAICANKPVVVPRNSWMSVQLGASQAGVAFNSGDVQDFVRAVATACANIATHRKAAEALGKKFREFHNPPNFVKQLMRSALLPGER